MVSEDIKRKAMVIMYRERLTKISYLLLKYIKKINIYQYIYENTNININIIYIHANQLEYTE